MTALLGISHGTADVAGQRAVTGLVAAVAEAMPETVVRLGHVDVQQPDVAACLAALPDERVVLVPLLLSAGYHVHVDLRRAIAHRDDVTITPALGPDHRLVAVLAARLAQAGYRGAEDPDADVVLAVAGSSDERANDDCRETARLLADRLGRPVTIAFLAAARPRVREAVARASDAGHRVFVATYLLAPGYFHDLAVREAPGAVVTRPLLDADAPATALVDLVVARYRGDA